MIKLEIKFDPMDMVINITMDGDTYSENELASFTQYIIEKQPLEEDALKMASVFISNSVAQLSYSTTRFLDERYLEINQITTNGVNR